MDLHRMRLILCRMTHSGASGFGVPARFATHKLITAAKGKLSDFRGFAFLFSGRKTLYTQFAFPNYFIFSSMIGRGSPHPPCKFSTKNRCFTSGL